MYGASAGRQGGRGGSSSGGSWNNSGRGGGRGGGGGSMKNYSRRNVSNNEVGTGGMTSSSSTWDSRPGRARQAAGGVVNGKPIVAQVGVTNVFSSSGGGGGGGGGAAPDTEPALRVLSFYEYGSRIAFACYSEDENEIIYEDRRAHTGIDTERVIQSVLQETRPNLILVSNKVVANAPLLECLTTRYNLDGEDENRNPNNVGTTRTESSTTTTTGSIPYQLLKSSAFEPKQCRTVILQQLRVLTLMRNGQPTTADRHEGESSFDHAQNYTSNIDAMQLNHHHHQHLPANKFHSLSSIIDFDSSTLVRALGSLLIYLRNTAFRLEEGYTVTINNLRRCAAPDTFLRLDELTLRTLRIFATDNGGGRNDRNRSKEGLSLFALLDRTKSKAGRERLRRWMSQPLRDVNAIRQRHVGMELFLHPDCHAAVSLIIDRLSLIGSMDSILLRMQRCCASQPNDFLVLGRMLDSSQLIIATLAGELREKAYKLDSTGNSSMDCQLEQGQQQQQQYPSVSYIDDLLRRCHVNVIRNLRERMVSIIDEEVTAETKDHVVIHYGFDEELDRAKETFEMLDGEDILNGCC